MIYRIVFGALILLLAVAGYLMTSSSMASPPPMNSGVSPAASTVPSAKPDDEALKGFKIP